MKRAYQYRFYPTPEQAHILSRTFGCARYVYNWALRLRTDAYYKEQKRIGYHETSAHLTLLKKQEETSWLNEVSSVPRMRKSWPRLRDDRPRKEGEQEP